MHFMVSTDLWVTQDVTCNEIKQGRSNLKPIITGWINHEFLDWSFLVPIWDCVQPYSVQENYDLKYIFSLCDCWRHHVGILAGMIYNSYLIFHGLEKTLRIFLSIKHLFYFDTPVNLCFLCLLCCFLNIILMPKSAGYIVQARDLHKNVM